MKPTFEPGVYQHFKGGKYSALCLAKDERTLEDVVVYVQLSDGSVWTRSLERWCEYVQWPNGKTNPRFLKIP
jgi:hypothetical protein